LSLLIAFALPAGAQERHREPYVPFPADKVHATVAEHGVVVVQEKIAAQIGADILRQGGKAVDAAIATGFAIAVT
jgi:gamma-glutamyltranspeptidase/glutathione hydrolase